MVAGPILCWDRNVRQLSSASLLVLHLCGLPAFAGQAYQYDQEPVAWESYETMWLKDLPIASASEPIRAHYSESKALAFASNVALKWSRQNQCGTCHTNIAYLMARPLLPGAASDPIQHEVREHAEEYLNNPFSEPIEFLPFLIATTASALAINDALTDGTFDPKVRSLFEQLWKIQNAGGSWDYPVDTTVPFLERNKYYVPLFVALALGYIPGQYYATPEARDGFAKLQGFLRTHMPDNHHEHAVLLWASARTPGLLTEAQRDQFTHELLDLQNADGGWTLPALGQWARHDGIPNDPEGPSDGYATALVTTALCQAQTGLHDTAINKSIHWLKSHQRVSGQWFTASLYSNRFHNYLSNMATSYALMALKSCEQGATPAVTWTNPKR